MGKGDRKTTRGKTYRGSYGKNRPHRIKQTSDKNGARPTRRSATRRRPS